MKYKILIVSFIFCVFVGQISAQHHNKRHEKREQIKAKKLEYIKTGSDTAVSYDSYVNLQLSLLEQYQPTAQ